MISLKIPWKTRFIFMLEKREKKTRKNETPSEPTICVFDCCFDKWCLIIKVCVAF